MPYKRVIQIFYKLTVEQFCSLQVIASVLFVNFFIKAYVVNNHLICTGKLMQFKLDCPVDGLPLQIPMLVANVAKSMTDRLTCFPTPLP